MKNPLAAGFWAYTLTLFAGSVAVIVWPEDVSRTVALYTIPPHAALLGILWVAVVVPMWRGIVRALERQVEAERGNSHGC